MEKDLVKFNKNISVINKDLSKYQDEKGIMFIFNTIKLITSVDVLEVSKEELQKGIFEGKIDDLEYNQVEIEKPVSKYSVTKREEDRYVLTNGKVKVRQVFSVINGLGIHKCFTNKDDAIKLANEINKKYLSYFK